MSAAKKRPTRRAASSSAAPSASPRSPARATRGHTPEPPAAPITRKRRDAEATREAIREAALALIRQRGFDAATMRDIARAAGVSQGLAYHYFESKEALALAFYGEHIARHDVEARRALATRPRLAERIEATLLLGIDVRAADRPVLLVMARTVLDAENPISLFSPETTALRERSIALFREVASVPEVHESLREPLALALWALHLGVLLRFVYDVSPGQKETRRLVEGASRLAAEITTMLGLPFLEELRREILDVLGQGGLLRPGPSPDRGTTSPDAPRDLDPDPRDAPPRPGRARRDRV